MKLSEKLKELKNDCLNGFGLDHDVLDDAFNRCIEDADLLESKAENLPISGVSESFRKEIRQCIEHHLEQEQKNAKIGNYQNAIYHSTTAAAMQEVLLRESNYSR